ncbi:MAG: beta galactosidase jelly roll domain-containing protein [Terrimicrobiaceae bacterium]
MKIFAVLAFCASGTLVLSAPEPPAPPFGSAAVPADAGSPPAISLAGEWRFAADPGEQGMRKKWHEPAFDDSSWKTLATGKSWRSQGVEHDGWGWFRREMMVPKACAGMPLILELGKTESDDDVWFNGVRVGGLHGKYKYRNLSRRVYAVPASLIRYGKANTIALRIWGGDLTFIGEPSQGLVAGEFAATPDPYGVSFREAGGAEQPAQGFDLSDAARGKPFEMIFRVPGEKISGPATLQCTLTDVADGPIALLEAPVEKGADGTAFAVVKANPALARTLAQRTRFRAKLVVRDAPGKILHESLRDLDHFSFARRDNLQLPPLANAGEEETPYGRLKLVDEIDCGLPDQDDPHPYLQSGFDKAQEFMTPGPPVNVSVREILGKKARESETGWFAYRIGRGKLKPHGTYLLRIEYADDKPRYCPIEISAGRNFLDVGWQSGVGAADDPYDPWPISHSWHWYDSIVSLDKETTGTSGANGAPTENGVWVYFVNKVTPNKYYALYDGGPAIARMKLYEIDAEKDAPAINLPKDLPRRTLMFDWERQAEAEPGDGVRYAKLMGYNAISPIMLKWGLANWGEPLNGYHTFGEDAAKYMVNKDYKPGANARPAVAGKDSQHLKYLAETKRHGIRYIPRVEYGGSLDIPEGLRAIGPDGNPAKPNRFGTWCADLLQPTTWDDLKKLMDHLIKPHAKDNPQLTGVLWRIRQDRMPISYSKFDLDLFARETGKLPAGSEQEQRAWTAGAGKAGYDTWWLEKRAQFHARLAALLRSYRPDMRLYYYNWDGDKFGMVLPSITTWAFLGEIAVSKDGANFSNDGSGNGSAVYGKDREDRKKLTGEDYINVMRSGDFGAAAKLKSSRADYAIRSEMYRGIKGVEIFAPANFLCYADKPDYLNSFQTAEGLAVSNCVSYDEIGARTINPRYEGSMTTPAPAAFSMALELLAWFHGDARTLSYTPYTYARGFADAHRRFAQAFLAIPAIPGTIVDQGDEDVKVRTYLSPNGTYVGVAYKGFVGKKFTVKVPVEAGAKVTNLMTGEAVAANATGDGLSFTVDSGPMELKAFLIFPARRHP